MHCGTVEPSAFDVALSAHSDGDVPGRAAQIRGAQCVAPRAGPWCRRRHTLCHRRLCRPTSSARPTPVIGRQGGRVQHHIRHKVSDRIVRLGQRACSSDLLVASGGLGSHVSPPPLIHHTNMHKHTHTPASTAASSPHTHTHTHTNRQGDFRAVWGSAGVPSIKCANEPQNCTAGGRRSSRNSHRTT